VIHNRIHKKKDEKSNYNLGWKTISWGPLPWAKGLNKSLIISRGKARHQPGHPRKGTQLKKKETSPSVDKSLPFKGIWKRSGRESSKSGTLLLLELGSVGVQAVSGG